LEEYKQVGLLRSLLEGTNNIKAIYWSLDLTRPDVGLVPPDSWVVESILSRNVAAYCKGGENKAQALHILIFLIKTAHLSYYTPQ
jgi:hypothetical protein